MYCYLFGHDDEMEFAANMLVPTRQRCGHQNWRFAKVANDELERVIQFVAEWNKKMEQASREVNAALEAFANGVVEAFAPLGQVMAASGAVLPKEVGDAS